VLGNFEIGSRGLFSICLRTTILLIFASPVAKITGTIHWRLAKNSKNLKDLRF
jgi:hypothetical protein